MNEREHGAASVNGANMRKGDGRAGYDAQTKTPQRCGMMWVNKKRHHAWR